MLTLTNNLQVSWHDLMDYLRTYEMKSSTVLDRRIFLQSLDLIFETLLHESEIEVKSLKDNEYSLLAQTASRSTGCHIRLFCRENEFKFYGLCVFTGFLVYIVYGYEQEVKALEEAQRLYTMIINRLQHSADGYLVIKYILDECKQTENWRSGSGSGSETISLTRSSQDSNLAGKKAGKGKGNEQSFR